MSSPFPHLHVASGYSLRYGASPPDALVARAGDLGQDILALTDRDGVYGAVRFVDACGRAGIRPVLGVDLAIRPGHPVGPAAHPAGRRHPARGGTWIDLRQPRVTLLAQGSAGWSSLCRIISAAHAGRTVDRTEQPMLADPAAAAGEGLVVLLGPASPVGVALAARRPDLADAALAAWLEVVDRGAIRIEVLSHQARSGPASSAVAARMLGWARDRGLTAVLTNAVRHADPSGAPVVDVLDAIRRLVPLDSRHRERITGEGYLKSTAQMEWIAHDIARAAGSDGPARGARALLAATRDLAEACIMTPADLGIGAVHVPELEVIVGSARVPADTVLRERCLPGLGRYQGREARVAQERLEAELRTISTLGFAPYFLTVAEVVDLIRGMGIRVAARGSGAGSLVNHLLGISGVDPIRHGLIMERFLSPLRRTLPDIDIDVESARRIEIYQRVLDRFGPERCACVSMRDTYRVRHAIRDVGAAFGLPPGEIDSFATAFPHIRARDARAALRDLPELRASGLGRLAAAGELDGMLSLVEALDGLPRHIALHPCGVLLSDATLLSRTPVEPSALGFPMSQFDKEEVEELGFLKLDILGIRMQSAMAQALDEVERIDGIRIDLDAVPLDDPATFELIRSTRTLGCFQIESPGQRELIGKFAPETFDDIIIDISLFRPGPVSSDMVTPFLRARQGWCLPVYLHDDLRPALRETFGVVVFHEQVLRIVSTMTGCSLAEADETRRSLGSPEGQDDVRAWFYPTALRRGYDLGTVERVWEVLRAFASFGFCKAHAAAFALPTYQSAWLKAHHPAAFLAGVLTHDPGMYPKRLILDDARQHGITVHGLDVNRSEDRYLVERTDSGYAIRLSLADVKGISEAEVHSIIRGRPYSSMSEFWYHAAVSIPIIERLVIAGGFDSVYGIGSHGGHRRGRITRRDLLLQARDLARHAGEHRARRATASSAQLTLDLVPEEIMPSGLPEMDSAERVRAELDVLGLDVSRHVVEFYAPMLDDLGVTRARDLLRCRSQAEILVAGVKVATQTPPIRSGRRVIFLTLDDSTGPVDATFFDDAQGPYASTLFHSWLLLVRGEVRRTGPRGVSLRATGCWELSSIHASWQRGGSEEVLTMLDASRSDGEVAGPRRVLVHPSGFRQSPYADIKPAGVGGTAPSRLWHASPGSSGW